jgi:hypothetical protein
LCFCFIVCTCMTKCLINQISIQKQPFLIIIRDTLNRRHDVCNINNVNMKNEISSETSCGQDVLLATSHTISIISSKRNHRGLRVCTRERIFEVDLLTRDLLWFLLSLEHKYETPSSLNMYRFAPIVNGARILLEVGRYIYFCLTPTDTETYLWRRLVTLSWCDSDCVYASHTPTNQLLVRRQIIWSLSNPGFELSTTFRSLAQRAKHLR